MKAFLDTVMARSLVNMAFVFQKPQYKQISNTINKSNRIFMGKCHQRNCYSTTTQEMTMKKVRQQLDIWLEFKEGYIKNPPDRSHLLKYLPASQDELPPRCMKDSYSTAIIPLSTEFKLHHRYSTVTGKLRMGRILEDMDFFAVYIALKHIKNPKWIEGQPSPYVIVTAAVDDIELTYHKPDMTNDIRLSGNVVYSGRTSMDVKIELEKKDNGGWEKMTVAHFTMVARNSTLTGPAVVNKLVPNGPEEEKEFKDASERRERKMAAQKQSLLVIPPNPEEQKLIHEQFMKSVDLMNVSLNRRILPAGSVWMEDSIITCSYFPHPENRNHHNTVFGGYLMRLALELAWMIAYKYSSQKPSLRYISNITFKESVALSSFLQIMGQIIYTNNNHMQIAIFIEILDIKTKQVKTSNSFYFTYEVKNPVKPIMPKTYQESIYYIDGRRQVTIQSQIAKHFLKK